MLKTAAYGFLRVSLDLLDTPIWWWGVLLLGIGLLTAMFGVIFAAVQTDMKRLLAWSSIENIGIIFTALGLAMVFRGVGMNALAALAVIALLYHCLNHAFMKSLLFLGSGSVIHGMHHEQDMYKMGGLRKAMPRTFLTFVAGSAALSGLPLLSGFFSKDEILAKNFALGGFHVLLWVVGVVSAALTAFYTWRMVALTFFGEERYDHHHVHPHESPAVVTVPLILVVHGGPEAHESNGWLTGYSRAGQVAAARGFAVIVVRVVARSALKAGREAEALGTHHRVVRINAASRARLTDRPQESQG